MLDRCNRPVTPPIEGRAHGRSDPRPIGGDERTVSNDVTPAIDSALDLCRIVHDLRNQLTTIKGWADHLQRRSEPGLDQRAIHHGLTMIQSSADAMDELLWAILDRGELKIGHGRPQTRADVDLWLLTEGLVDQYRTLADGHEITLLGPGPGQVIGNWDAGSVGRILANLLSNAIKYSSHGGQITITIERIGHEAHLTVHDQGIGIPTPALPYVFEPFYRAGNVVEYRGSMLSPGMGIGLFAARTLAQQHNGRIEVESTEGQGSEFTLILPMHVGR